MFGLIWTRGLLRRRAGRLAAQAAGVALAVLLLASLGAFFAASKARMTQEASAGVPVDWQIQLAGGTDPSAALKTVTSAPGVVTARPVGYADASAFRARTGRSVQTTGSRAVSGRPGYTAGT